MTKITHGMIGVVTGGGAGMGRQLCVQLCKQGAKVAACDVNEDKLEETVAECKAAAPGADVFTFICDVSNEEQCIAFKDATLNYFKTESVNLLFNNAGISGGGSFVAGPRVDWEACFNVCWFGVYYMSRAFVPHLIKANSAHITNTSSVNGFWASLGPQSSHTAYSAAKFAVKGFTEALLNDMKLNAPHVGVSLVCPGHIGTDIAINSQKKTLELQGDSMFEGMRKRILSNPDTPDAMKARIQDAPKEALGAMMDAMGRNFRDSGMTANDAAQYILNAVEAGQWRVLVGNDAERLDAAVRADPEAAYGEDFAGRLALGAGGDNSNLAKQQEELGLLVEAKSRL